MIILDDLTISNNCYSMTTIKFNLPSYVPMNRRYNASFIGLQNTTIASTIISKFAIKAYISNIDEICICVSMSLVF